MSESIPCYTYLESPVGRLLLAGDDKGLITVGFPRGHGARRPEAHWREDAGALAEARRQIGEYFNGGRREFDLPYKLEGDSFQQAVWRAMLEIPYGETRSYGEIARHIGESVAASRAVGIACGQNPLPIVVPCHRVIGADGSLTGFGGGIETKKRLLALEYETAPPAGTLFAAVSS